jgi:hypothetical protein
MKMKFFPPFKDEGEVVAAWGQAQLIKYLDGKTELKGGSKEDRLAAQEWISLFWHEAVVGPENGESGKAYFRKSQRRNLRSKLTRMQVTSGKWKEKFPLEKWMSPGKRPSQPFPNPVHSIRPTRAMTTPKMNSILPSSLIQGSF